MSVFPHEYPLPGMPRVGLVCSVERPDLALRHKLSDEAAEAFCLATARRWASSLDMLPAQPAGILRAERMAGATSYRAQAVSDWAIIAAAYAAAPAATSAGEAACAAIVAKAQEHGFADGQFTGLQGDYEWDFGTPSPQRLPGYETAFSAVIRKAMADEAAMQRIALGA